MAQKHAVSESDRRDEAAKHPWIQLLDLEQQTTKIPLPKGNVGRPPRRFPRTKRILLSMTGPEVEAVDTLVRLIGVRMNGDISRNDVIAFMAFKLIDDLATLEVDENHQPVIPEGVKSFTELARYLERGHRQLEAPPEVEVEKKPAERRRKKTTESPSYGS